MNIKDIVKWSREAGGSIEDPSDLLTLGNLSRFAALAQQAEPAREWQFLSAEERYRIADESASTIVAVLATEAALKEKNHG